MTLNRSEAQSRLRKHWGDKITETVDNAIEHADTAVLSVQCYVMGLATKSESLPWED